MPISNIEYILNIGALTKSCDMNSLTQEMPSASLLMTLRDRLIPLQDHLSLPHLACLFTIAVEPGLSINDLGKRIGVPQPSASRYASTLLGRYQEPEGKSLSSLLIQEINQDDPRRRALHLSDQGREIVTTLCQGLRLISENEIQET